MKLSSLLGLTLGVSLGFAVAEEERPYTGLYLASGLTEENGVISGWYDAEKTREEDVDDPMCYAASAANILAWWQNGTNAAPGGTPTELNDIWSTFKNNNQYMIRAAPFISPLTGGFPVCMYLQSIKKRTKRGHSPQRATPCGNATSCNIAIWTPLRQFR